MKLLFFLFGILFVSLFFAPATSSGGPETDELDSLKQVLENHSSHDNSYLETLITLGRKVRSRDFEKSEAYLTEAISLSRQLSATHHLIRSLNGLGLTYGMQDQYVEAIRNFNEAVQLALKHHFPEQAEIAYSSLGIVYKRMGEYPTSLSYYSKSLALNDSLHNAEGIASNCHNLGVLFALMREPDKALDYYEKALKWYESQNNQKRVADLRVNIGAIHLNKGNNIQALELFETALKYLEENQYTYDALNARANIGHVYLKNREYPKAEACLWPALKEAETHHLVQVKSSILYNLAKVKAEMGAYAQSLDLAMKVKQLADSTRSLKAWADAHELLSFVYQKAGNLDRALQHYRYFSDYQDSIFNDTKTQSYKNQQVLMEVHEKDRKLEAQALNLAFLNQQVILENRWKWTLGFASLFLLVAVGLYYQKYRQRQKYSDALESKNEVITEQKKEIEGINLQLEKRMLRAQMNPHFIFNALSSIQHFITANDKVSALHYLSRFSHMLRQILETSVNVNMALKDEIELIKTYLELEALRFENDFEYEIAVEENLNIEMIEIPTMIIQPFVENAILHGLMPNQGDRKLCIDIREKGSSLICTITDNGIGREASERINKDKTGKSRSRGVSVTRQRVDLLARNHGVRTGIRYTDLKDETGKALGTKVELSIPKQEL